jgi:Sec-independent protein translocase protein TatA
MREVIGIIVVIVCLLLFFPHGLQVVLNWLGV